MSERARASHREHPPVGSGALALLGLCGVLLGALAKMIGSIGRTFEPAGVPLIMLGMGTAIWVTAGFLVARRIAKNRSQIDGAVWAGTGMAVYLSAWLLAYSVVFGLQQDGGFAAAWLNERLYFILAPAAGAVLGLVAAASWRTDWLGDACIIAPIAWSLPEIAFASAFGWQHVLFSGIPALALASVPLATAGRNIRRPVASGALVLGGILALLLMRLVTGGKI